jgi:cytochrome P450
MPPARAGWKINRWNRGDTMTNFGEFGNLDKTGRRFEANRLLFKWLSNDDERAALYRYLLDEERRKHSVLQFQSRADTKLRPTQDRNSVFQQEVYLLTTKNDVVKALTDTVNFSNSPYQALGSGTFMLGLDVKSPDHEAQRAFASAYLRHINSTTIAALTTIAFKAAAVLPLKQRQFDLADLAEQTALRFVTFLFGFAQADHPLIEATMRKAYLGLNYQILGRHFVTQPGVVVPDAVTGMGALLQRAAYLIDLYRERVGREQEDDYATIDAELEELKAYTDGHDKQALGNFVPILKRIAEHAELNPQQTYSGTELAVIVVGLIAGTIGNVQASVSIAINAFFDPHNKILQRALDAAKKSFVANPDADPNPDPDLQALIWEALRLNPPVAFLPRRTLNKVDLEGGTVPEDKLVILAMGGAARDGPDDPDAFDEKRKNYDDIYPLIFGGPPPPAVIGQGGRPFVHQCIGERVSMPLITHIVREVLVLPELAESLDPLNAKPVRLRKLWGFNCQTYPMEFNRFKLLKHSPLSVIMNVKMPVSEHAEALKKVIKYGAPRIEKKLNDARHVHFAQFLFLENDTKLALFTWYDRDFDSYIEHFALQVGPLFDRLFEHIQDAPPLPVDKYPKEFVDTIRRFNVGPAGGYFYSAYPQVEAATITNHYTRKKT